MSCWIDWPGFPLAYTLTPLKRVADMTMTAQNKDSDVWAWLRQVLSLSAVLST